MMIANGCSSISLVKFAQDDLKTLVTLLFIEIFALYDGFLTGLLVPVSWYVTSIGMCESIEKVIGLSSLSFVYPSAQTLELFTYYKRYDLSFGISLAVSLR